MVSVGLAHRWRSLFTTGKGVPSARGVPGAPGKVTVLPVTPGQSKLRVLFARLACGSWIRRKAVASISTPATTVSSSPSEVPRSPESLSQSTSQNSSLSALVTPLTAVTEPQSDLKRKTELIAVLERVDRIVDGFHRVLGAQLTSKQYRACLRARVAMHFVLSRLEGTISAGSSRSLHDTMLAFADHQIRSDGGKANAEQIVKQVVSVYPSLEGNISLQSQDDGIFSCAADVLKDVLKEFAGLEQKGVYDSYVNFGLMLRAMAPPAETPLVSSVHQNPFQLALDWSHLESGLHPNVMLESLGAAARANYIQQVKEWGVELKSIGEALSAIYDVSAILVSSEAASFAGIVPEDLAQEKIRASERERVRELANARIQPGADWIKNINDRNKVRKAGGVSDRFQSAQKIETGAGSSFPRVKDPAKAYTLEIAKRIRFETRNSSASLAGVEKTEKSQQIRERSKARRGATPDPHPAVQAFKDELFRSEARKNLDARKRPMQLESKFSHVQHKFTFHAAQTDPKAGK
jgi:hypothetical protein